MNVIETAGLGRRYCKTWALRDCTLAIPAGRVTALTGPNGAGKTTLMHMAGGLIAPTQGPGAGPRGPAPRAPQALKAKGVRAPGRPPFQHLPARGHGPVRAA